MDWSLGLSMSLSKYLDQLGLNGFSLPNLFLRNFLFLFDVDTPCFSLSTLSQLAVLFSLPVVCPVAFTPAHRELSLSHRNFERQKTIPFFDYVHTPLYVLYIYQTPASLPTSSLLTFPVRFSKVQVFEPFSIRSPHFDLPIQSPTLPLRRIP